MANPKGQSNVRNMMYNTKNSLLPPKIPFPSISPSYLDYAPSPTINPKSLPNPGKSNPHPHHLRTSSESFLLEDQPSWLDELLDEPDTPVHRRHRRSSSDSFTYIDLPDVGNMNLLAQDDNRFKNITPVPLHGTQEFDLYRAARQGFLHDPHSLSKTNMAWDAHLSSRRGFTSPRDNTSSCHAVLSKNSQQLEKKQFLSTEKQETVESGPKVSSDKKESSLAKSLASESDTKRAKQQFAQRSRVRKLQYIAELERNVLALEAKGSAVSAELGFFNEQNLILTMENKALKQRLENLAQEKVIKYLEQEVLEREVGRLRALYQQLQKKQPQKQQQSPGHRRISSRDLDQQFASLSLKKNETTSNCDPVSGQFRI